MKEISLKRPNDDLIEGLKEMLELAKSGDLIGLLAIEYRHAGEVEHFWAVDERAMRFQMLGYGHYVLQHFASEIAAHYGDTPFEVEA